MRSLLLLLIFCCGFSSFAHADEIPSLQSMWLNRQGAQLLREQKSDQALEKFSQALALDPEVAGLHLNMGLAFEMSGQPEKALQAYETAAKTGQDQSVQFAARFNQGVLYQKAKKVDQALAAYHAALELNPDSRETKINIELLIQDQQGQGQGENQDQDKGDQSKDNKDQQNQKGQGKDDQKDPKDDKDGDQKKDQPKQYGKNKPQPRQFKSEDLTPADAKKILGEIRNQEQRIRAEYNKREVKEKPRDKDW